MTSSFSTSVQYVYLRLRSNNKYSNGTPYAYTLLFIVCLLETVYIKVSKLSGLIVPRTLMSTGNFTLGWFRYRYYHVNSINQGKKNTGISGSNLLKTLISSGNRILVWYRYFQVKPIYQYGKPVATMAYLLIHLICIIAVIKLHMHFFLTRTSSVSTRIRFAY